MNRLSLGNKTLIIAFEKGYIVDDTGNIFFNSRQRKLNKDTKGYYSFTICTESGNRRRVQVHRMQAYKKFGDKIFNEEIEVRHLDGNRLNNIENNIGIGNHSQNMNDVPKKKRHNNAINASMDNRIFNDEKIKKILEDRKGGMSYAELALKYKGNRKSKGHIYTIIKNNGYVQLIK